MLKRVSFEKFPIKAQNSFVQAFELKIDDENLFNLADSLRIGLQLMNMKSPYISIPVSGEGSVLYENGKQPIQSYSINLETSLLPLNYKLNDGQLNKKACYVICNEINEFEDIKTITSHDLKLFIGKELSRIPVTDEKYLVTRLRKGERISFKGDIKTASATTAQGAVIHTPFSNYDETRKVMQFQFESRGYFTINQILESYLNYMNQKYKRYKSIFLDEASEENMKLHHYTLLSDKTKEKNVYMYREFDIQNEDEVDFDLAIKNALANHINNIDGLLFNFEYETNRSSNKVVLVIETKEHFNKLKKIFVEHEKFLSTLL